MSHVARSLTVAMVCAMLSLPLALPSAAVAHEHRHVGPFEMVVGWADEPPYVGFKNAVELRLKDRSGKAVTDLGDTLKVEILLGDQKMGPLSLNASDETPGEYLAPIIPTRPGAYTFHFIGAIRGQKVDQSFTASEKTFDPVAGASEIEFPAKDPSRGELAERLGRVTSRVDAAQSAVREASAAAGQARTLAVLGIVLGALGLAVSLASSRRRAIR